MRMVPELRTSKRVLPVSHPLRPHQSMATLPRGSAAAALDVPGAGPVPPGGEQVLCAPVGRQPSDPVGLLVPQPEPEEEGADTVTP